MQLRTESAEELARAVRCAVRSPHKAKALVQTANCKDTLAKWLGTGEVTDIGEGWQRLVSASGYSVHKSCIVLSACTVIATLCPFF